MSTTSQSVFRDIKSSDLDSTILRGPTEKKWRRFWLIMLTMPDYVLWNVFILSTTILNYILVTVNLCFLNNDVLNFLPVYVILDTIYLLNFFLLALHRLVKIPFAFCSKKSILIITIDLLSLLPMISLIIPLIDNNYSYLVPLFRIGIFVRLRHLIIFKNVLQRLTEHRVLWFLVQYVVTCCLIIHTAICTWFLIRCKEECPNKLYESKIQETTTGLEWYLYHVYFTLQLLLNIGFGDVFPRHFEEVHFFSAMFVAGQSLMIWLICYVAWLLINLNYHKQNISHKIENVERYVSDNDEYTKWIISHYYTLKEHNIFKDNSLLNILSPSLKQDVDYDLNCGLLHRSLILKDLPMHILKKISSIMKTVVLPAEESIYFQYVVKGCMVCVEDGILQILNDEDEESPVVYFRTGTILGEIALFMNIPSKATVMAAKNCELRILEKQDFMNIMLHFPQHLKNLQTAVKLRLITANRSPRGLKNRLQSLRKLKSEPKIISLDDDKNVDDNCHDLYKLLPKDFKDRTSFDDNKLLNIWKVISGIVQIILCVVYPYYAVFERTIPDYLATFVISTDITCLLDIILQFRLDIKSKGGVIGDIPNILDQKLNDWRFNLDILSVFPMEIWTYVFENHVTANRLYNLFKFNRLLRLHRISEIGRILNGTPYLTLKTKIVHTSLYLSFAIYFSCCALYLNGCLYVICEDTSWYFLSSREIYPQIQESSTAFLTSLYFTIVAAFYTGIGDNLPKSPSDFFIVTIIIILFLFLKSYWLGQVIAATFLNMVCNGVLETKNYLKKINPFFYREHSKKFIKETATSSIKSIFQISGTTGIDEGPFFENVDSYFLALIEKDIKSWLLPKNETVYTYGDPTRTMFILQNGYCRLYNAINLLEKTVGPGSYLGYLETIYCLPKKYTVVTITDCNVICLEYSVLDRILKVFPKELDIIERTKYNADILEDVRKIEMISDTETPAVSHIDIIDVEEEGFVNVTKTWPNYFRVYKNKLGAFWFMNVIFLPATIHPDGLFIKVWCVIRTFLIILQGVVLIVLNILPPFANEINWIDFACQLSLYVDMYLLLHVGYYDGKGIFKVHPAYTAWHYLTHGFTLDLLAAIPWQLIAFHIYPPNSENIQIDKVALHSNHCSWNLMKLIQFYKVWKCLSYFQNHSFQYVVFIKMLKILVSIILFSNLLTSIGISYFCQYELDQNVTDIFSAYEDGTAVMGYIKCQAGILKENWIYGQFPDTNEIYAIGMYIILNVITNTGLGDVPATSTFMKIGTIVVTFIGFLLFAILTAAFCSVMMAEADKNFNFRDKVSRMSQFLESNNVHFALKRQILNHFDLTWRRSQGFNVDAHKNLYCDTYFKDRLLMDKNEALLNDIPLFPNLDMNYLNVILGQIKIMYFQKGESIIRYKDIISNMYIIGSGQVEISDKNGDHIYTLGSAGVFGNIRNTVYSSSTVFVEARKNVELWILNTEKFLNTIKYYPLIIQDLEKYFGRSPDYLVPSNTCQFDFFSATREELDELESDEESMRRPSSMFLSKYTAFQLCIPYKWLRFALLPDCNLFKLSDFLTLLASLVNMYVIPYIFITQDNGTLGYVPLILEPIFYLRILFKLHKGYVNSYGNLIMTSSRIYRKYLNTPGEVFWDIVPNIPVDLICFSFPKEERFFFYSCFRLYHLLRFYYIVKYFDMQFKKLIRKTWWYLASLLIYCSILVHLLACIWFMLACPFVNCNYNSWLKHFSNEVFERSAVYKLVLSYYWVLNILTTTGIGDITPVTYWEIVFTLITMLVGKIAISICIGTVLKMMYISEKRLLDFNTKYQSLKSYLRDKNISEYPLQRTSLYLENLWIYTDGMVDSDILYSLSYPLKQDLTSALYGTQLRDTFLFKGADQSLLLQVCTKLRRTAYFKDDYVVKTGDVNSTMYFIHNGDVCVLTKHSDHLESKHVILHAKDLFGVSQGLNLEECHNFCYRAITPVVEVLALKFDDWSYILPFFPREKKRIFSRVNKEYSKV